MTTLEACIPLLDSFRFRTPTNRFSIYRTQKTKAEREQEKEAEKRAELVAALNETSKSTLTAINALRSMNKAGVHSAPSKILRDIYKTLADEDLSGDKKIEELKEIKAFLDIKLVKDLITDMRKLYRLAKIIVTKAEAEIKDRDKLHYGLTKSGSKAKAKFFKAEYK